jgi:uncharacterized protein (TIGR03437 family)
MYRTATVRVPIATVLASLGLFAQIPGVPQAPATLGAAEAASTAVSNGTTNGATNTITWRRIGNALIDRSLAGLATGPVDRVWYSADGSQLTIRTSSGNTFTTSDFETWQPASLAPPPYPPPLPISGRLPEADAQTRAATAGSSRTYAFAKFVYSSENGGASWDNLTAYRNTSLIGGGLRDLAVSPANDQEATVASSSGVFRTVDGGKSWSGLNQGLPNLPVAQLLSLPSGDQGTRLALPDASVIEWQPGQKQAWLASGNSDYVSQLALRQALSARERLNITALEQSGEMVYVGTFDGQVRVSTDSGKTFLSFYTVPEGGAVERFWTDPKDPRIAVAVLAARPQNAPPSSPAVHVLRTVNGGAVWDDMTGNLPDAAVHGVTADRSSDAVYVASSRGVFYAAVNLETLGGAVSWTALSGLPEAPAADVKDVKLDDGGNQLFAAIQGYGVYSTLAPHRFNDPRVVSTADFVARAAAPGSLISVAGAPRVTSGQALGQTGVMPVAVLASTDTETQIQIPFEARGSSLSLAVSSGDRNVTLPPVPLEAAAPAIFVAPDGSPNLYDAESGVMLDAMTPAHSRGHIQILATGLGRVTPDWPTGLAGPVDNPPKVAATVNAYLDRQPVEVTKAVLAPYIGYYLIEIEVPKIVNYGPAELYLQVGGQLSNRVRVYIEP